MTSTWPTEVLDLIGITAAYLAGVLYINRSKAAHKKLLAHLTAQRNSQR